MEAGVALARRIERAEIDFVSLIAGIGEPAGAPALEVAGGRALYSRPGSPMNKVLGLGVGSPVSDADLDALEQFYEAHACPIQVELCPLAATDLPARLCARGFVLKAFENELACVFGVAAGAGGSSDSTHRGNGDGVSLEPVDAGNEDAYLDVVAEGFAAGEPSNAPQPEIDRALIEGLREVMRPFAHPSITRYLVRVDGQPAGGGSWYLHAGTVGIIGTATLPRFRRRGVQRAVAARALRDGATVADLAIVTTEPGSTSQRTFERLGFQVVYTRAVLVKER